MDWSENFEKNVTGEEKPAAVNTAKNMLQMTCDIDDVLTYATVHNGAHFVRDICIKNISESDLDDLMLRICSNNNLTENFELGIGKIKPDEELHFKNLNVLINAGYLASLTERSICQITVGIYFEEKQMISETMNITALAYDQWPGL